MGNVHVGRRINTDAKQCGSRIMKAQNLMGEVHGHSRWIKLISMWVMNGTNNEISPNSNEQLIVDK